MPEGTLQLEHLMQATKLLQLKKASLADIEIIFDGKSLCRSTLRRRSDPHSLSLVVCWMLTPTQIQSKHFSSLHLPKESSLNFLNIVHRTRRKLLRCRLRESHLTRNPSRCQRSCRRWGQERSPAPPSRGRRSWTLRDSSSSRGYWYRGESILVDRLH